MSKILIASASVLVLALGVAGVEAHQAGQGMMFGFPGHMGPSMMESGGWGPGMMSSGMMNPAMMLVMMDTDDDGTLSLDEFQALHARMFAFLDANDDGQIDADELGAFHADGNSE